MNGYRITERKEPAPVAHAGRKRELSQTNVAMLKTIPVYPMNISIMELSQHLGVSRRSIESRLETCEGHALVCQEGERLSLLEAM